ncbi:MAG: hypothetical protein D6820_06610, partial [Lentisphaerae bacterium]
FLSQGKKPEQIAETMRTLTAKVEKSPVKEDAVLFAASAELRLKHWENAINLFQQYLKVAPQRQPFADIARLGVINAMLSSGDPQQFSNARQLISQYLNEVTDPVIKEKLQIAAVVACLLTNQREQAMTYLNAMKASKEESAGKMLAESLLTLIPQIPDNELKELANKFPPSLLLPPPAEDKAGKAEKPGKK